MIFRKVSVAVTVALAAACAGSGKPESTPQVPGPVIGSIEPTSGWAGTSYPLEVVIAGRGFSDRGNVVHFGGISIVDLPSTDGGTRIVFQAPKQSPGTGGAAPMVLLPGQYPITVTTSAGTSAPVDFELVRGDLNFD